MTAALEWVCITASAPAFEQCWCSDINVHCVSHVSRETGGGVIDTGIIILAWYFIKTVSRYCINNSTFSKQYLKSI